MSIYRSSSIPPPLHRRTEVSPSDLQHLDVVRRILGVLDEPAASAKALAQLIDEMPVLAARLGTRAAKTETALALMGNRRLEQVLFQLLEDLTVLNAEQASIPATGSMLPPLVTLRPPPEAGSAVVIVPRDEPERTR